VLAALNTYEGVGVVAVDSSMANLSYARRKLEERGGGPVEFVLGAIPDLQELDEQFDLVQVFVGMHLMDDADQAVMTLAARAKPGGLVFMGLYSQVARQAVSAAHDFIAERSIVPTLAGLRTLRRDLMLNPASPELELLPSPASDFWTASECMDLMFEFNERRFELGEVGELLESAGLEFLGVELSSGFDRERFMSEHPEADAYGDLAIWQAFEEAHPEIFGSTYRIWSRKRHSRP
jgi:SAM-dependent methyltransferase